MQLLKDEDQLTTGIDGARYLAMVPQGGMTPPAGGPAASLAPRGPAQAMSTPDPTAQPLAASPAQPTQPAQPAKSPYPEWMSPEQQKMFDKAKRAAQNYRKAVDQRRTKRKQGNEYRKLYNQMEREVGMAEDLDKMQSTYPDLFPADDPRTLGLVRTQAKHVEAAERLRTQLRQHLKKLGVPVGDKDPLPEDPFNTGDDEDKQFDSMIQRGFVDSMMTPYGE